MVDEHMRKLKEFLERRAPSTIVGVIIIGVIVTLLYDLIIKPGLSGLGRHILNVVTLGSTTIRDYAYSQAALDPTSVSALMLLLVVLSLPFGFMTATISIRFRNLRKKEGEPQVRSKTRALFGWLFPVLLLFFLMVHNQSIAIWRTFNANMKIITPYLSEQERLKLYSQFSEMSTKEEYEAINKIFVLTANNNDLQLRDIGLW